MTIGKQLIFVTVLQTNTKLIYVVVMPVKVMTTLIKSRSRLDYTNKCAIIPESDCIL